MLKTILQTSRKIFSGKGRARRQERAWKKASSRALAVSRVVMSSLFAGEISLLVRSIIFNLVGMIYPFIWSIISDSHAETNVDKSGSNWGSSLLTQ